MIIYTPFRAGTNSNNDAYIVVIIFGQDGHGVLAPYLRAANTSSILNPSGRLDHAAYYGDVEILL